MVLHAVIVCDIVWKWSPENIALQKHHYVLQRSESTQVREVTVVLEFISEFSISFAHASATGHSR